MKWVIRILLLAAVGAGLFYLWAQFRDTPELPALSLVPADAVFIAETREPISAWKDVTDTEMWRRLAGNPWFAEVTADAAALDSLIREYDWLADAIANRPVTLSVHTLKAEKDYDFLYVVDAKGAALGTLNELLRPVLKQLDANVTTLRHKGKEILEIYDPEARDRLYLTLSGNLVAATYSRRLIYAAIDAAETHELELNPSLKTLREETGIGQVNLYVQFSELDDYLRLFTAGQDELLGDVAKAADFYGAEFNMSDEWLEMDGLLKLKSEGAPLLSALAKAGRGKLRSPAYAPDRVSALTSLQFSDYGEVYDAFLADLKQDPAAWKEYEDNTRKLEKFLKINLREHFIDWIGEEAALLNIRPVRAGQPSERVLMLHAKSQEKARAGLSHIEKMIRKRTPFKFKTIDYKEYEIHLFKQKGFFKLILGKLFEQFDKPYFTFIDDFVVFAANENILMDVIDDYIAKRTLEKSEAWQDYSGKFSDRAHVFVYLNTQNTWPLAKEYLEPADWTQLVENETYFRSFRGAGFQLTGREGFFEAVFRARYVPLSPEEQAEEPKPAPPLAAEPGEDGVYVERFGNEQVKLRARYKDGKLDGEYISYYRNGNIREQGVYQAGEKIGDWYAYSRRGELQSRETFGVGE